MADDKTTKTPEQPVTDSGPGKVHRYIPELNAAVLTENAVVIMPNGKKPVYDTKKSKCHKVIPLAQALELLRCK